MANNLYTEDSIESLSPLDFTRLRPQVYCGNTEYSTQLLVEIFSNSVDEHRLGHGNKIFVKIKTNPYTVSVTDWGQGFIPNSFREDDITILEAAYSVLNTSGKFRDDGTYEGTSLGSFGIGNKITTFLSHELIVSSGRDGLIETITFKEGVFEKRKISEADKNFHGTIVTWQPSEEFFDHVEIDLKVIRELFKTTVCLCPGLNITLLVDDKEEIFYSTNGLNDLLDEKVGDKELINRRLELNYKEDKYSLDLLMTYTSNYSLSIIPYVNTGLTDSGPHITQIKSVLTREMNKYLKEKKIITSNLSGDELQEGIFIIFNATVPSVAYDAQVKSRITKIDFKKLSAAFAESLVEWMHRNPSDIKLIAEKAIKAKKAKEAAKKARDAVRNKSDKKKGVSLNLPTKLVDAWSKDRGTCELIISEGDSAASGLISGRDSEFQAVFPIRGKIINVFKASSEKIFANQEVINITKALGLTLDNKTHKLIYDEDKLRYGKILLACDADPDGQAIKNLLLTYFWWLCPELILNGHLYITIPPLFRVTNKKNEYIYLRDAAALAQYKEEHLNEKYIVSRNKGLGESDADELEECLLNPKTRNVQQLTVDDMEAAAALFEIVSGKNADLRKRYIEEYGEEAHA